ncbi:hypothetical protein [Lignipirellula cremea]|uniref:Cobyrinic acid A,C-diamide synthase n=1 Tax=Lignipirellula cremea TaxID=2528010 RepID=A0A518DUP2_9BACT|nr:hypothetical protein [Lignipirellula cremea]QDU95557.1 Cobyrinic acid A,C-diamide synthase [Lignipirellula cremea]
MSRQSCRQRFGYAAHAADGAMVCGSLGAPLEQLRDWLDLPLIAVLDAQDEEAFGFDSCRMPPSEHGIDGVLIVGAGDAWRAAALRTSVEALWRVPVLGVLDEPASLRAEVQAACATDAMPSRSLQRRLAQCWRAGLKPEVARQIAQRPFPWNASELFHADQLSPLRVAVAFDDAFYQYLPHTFDVLEACGAEVRDFSPLVDDCLPPCDLVYLGGGRVAEWAESLSQNCCMRQALALHLLRGGKLYAETDAAAYLCRELLTADGRHHAMLGVLPGFAVETDQTGLSPVAVTLPVDTWLGDSGHTLQGYADQGIRLLPAPALACEGGFISWPATHDGCSGMSQGGVIGSRLGLDLLACAEHLKRSAKAAPVAAASHQAPFVGEDRIE